MTYLAILKAQLIEDEGRENKMYYDSERIPSIGIGHNLRDNPISDAAVDQIFTDDIAPIEAECRELFSNFNDLSDVRKACVMNMCFNLGQGGLATFTTFIHLVVTSQFAAAADDMATTSWAKQVGDRAVRLADAMRAG